MNADRHKFGLGKPLTQWFEASSPGTFFIGVHPRSSAVSTESFQNNLFNFFKPVFAPPTPCMIEALTY